MKKYTVCCSRLLALLLLSFAYAPCKANVRLPALFADNMVLQQNAEAAIWGWADPGENVTISGSWNGRELSVVAGPSGTWALRLPTTSAGGPYRLSVSGHNRIELSNILLGEVWLCSGQSNMDFRMAPSTIVKWRTGVDHFEEEIAAANYPLIRMFTVVQNTSDHPLNQVQGSWEVCSPATAGNFSAVAYYFAHRLQQALHVPVGLIHSSWGGTPAEAWTPWETLASSAVFQPILDRFDSARQKFAADNQQYAAQLAQWKSSADTSVKPPAKPAAVKFHQSPAQLYNAMIAPLVPFTIKGVLWYQGESNSGRAYQYRQQFPALIASWRQGWKAQLPFYFVQIAPHKDQSPEIREAQFLTYRRTPQTGMVVITDAGDSADIHPRNKEVVGQRLALWALAKTYGKKDLAYSGPLYRSYKVQGSEIWVSFDQAKELKVKGDRLTQFTIAGADQRFLPARARIEGSTVVVWNDAVPHPVAVRFGWSPVPKAELYNEAGLPASPFRTDDWPEASFQKK